MTSTAPSARMAEAYRRCRSREPITRADANQLCRDIDDGLAQGSQSEPIQAIQCLLRTVVALLEHDRRSRLTPAVLELLDGLAHSRFAESPLGRCRAAARDALVDAIRTWHAHGHDANLGVPSDIADMPRRLAYDKRAFLESTNTEVRDGTLRVGFGPDHSTVYYPPETRLAYIALGAIVGSGDDVCADAMQSRRAALDAQSRLPNLYEAGDYQKVADEAERHLSAWPDLAEVWGIYGLALVELDRTEEAVKAYQEAVSMSGSPAAARHHYNLACAHARARSSDKARDSLRRAIAIQPGYCRPLAVDDPDLDEVRGEPWFRDLVSVDRFIEDLDGDDEGLRRNAVDTIAKLGDAKAEPHLTRIIRDPTEPAQLRAAAVEAVRAILGAGALDPLREVFADPDHVEIRLSVARALASLGGEAPEVLAHEIKQLPDDAQPPLVRALSAGDAPTNFAVLYDLAMSGPKEVAEAAVGTLEEMARRPPDFNVLRDDAVNELRRIAKDAKPSVQASAIEALASVRDPALADVVRPALADPAPEIRAAAAGALLHFEEPERGQRLSILLDDPEEAVRRAAEMVCRLTGKGHIPRGTNQAEGPDAGGDQTA